MKFEWHKNTFLINGLVAAHVDTRYGFDAICDLNSALSHEFQSKDDFIECTSLEGAKSRAEKMAKKAAYNAAYITHFYKLSFPEMLKEGW